MPVTIIKQNSYLFFLSFSTSGWGEGNYIPGIRSESKQDYRLVPAALDSDFFLS